MNQRLERSSLNVELTSPLSSLSKKRLLKSGLRMVRKIKSLEKLAATPVASPHQPTADDHNNNKNSNSSATSIVKLVVSRSSRLETQTTSDDAHARQQSPLRHTRNASSTTTQTTPTPTSDESPSVASCCCYVVESTPSSTTNTDSSGYLMPSRPSSSSSFSASNLLEQEEEEQEEATHSSTRSSDATRLRSSMSIVDEADNLDNDDDDEKEEEAWIERLFLLMRDESVDESGGGGPPMSIGAARHLAFGECHICLEEHQVVSERACCSLLACEPCLNKYVQTAIRTQLGRAQIACPSARCGRSMHRDEIVERMSRYDPIALRSYFGYLAEANSRHTACKTCPRCSHLLNHDDYKAAKEAQAQDAELHQQPTRAKMMKKKKTKKKKNEHDEAAAWRVECGQCELSWCFRCHAPWHASLTCADYAKGDKQLKSWARESHYGQPNAQHCPKCRILIQRNKGCDHMLCPGCRTEFCYKCGARFRHLKFIGDHYSKLSVLGCRYRLYPERPLRRRLIRGSLLGAELVALPLVAGAAVALGAGALVVGCVALPIYASYRLIKSRMHNNNNNNKMSADDETKKPASGPPTHSTIGGDKQPTSYRFK